MPITPYEIVPVVKPIRIPDPDSSVSEPVAAGRGALRFDLRRGGGRGAMGVRGRGEAVGADVPIRHVRRSRNVAIHVLCASSRASSITAPMVV